MDQATVAGLALFWLYVAFSLVFLALAILYAIHLHNKTKDQTAELTVTKEWHKCPRKP